MAHIPKQKQIVLVKAKLCNIAHNICAVIMGWIHSQTVSFVRKTLNTTMMFYNVTYVVIGSILSSSGLHINFLK